MVVMSWSVDPVKFHVGIALTIPAFTFSMSMVESCEANRTLVTSHERKV